jgi:hypothetical protein
MGIVGDSLIAGLGSLLGDLRQTEVQNFDRSVGPEFDIGGYPNICTIYDAGEADGETYIAMELLVDRSLSELIGGQGLPTATGIRYGAQLADARPMLISGRRAGLSWVTGMNSDISGIVRPVSPAQFDFFTWYELLLSSTKVRRNRNSALFVHRTYNKGAGDIHRL